MGGLPSALSSRRQPTDSYTPPPTWSGLEARPVTDRGQASATDPFTQRQKLMATLGLLPAFGAVLILVVFGPAQTLVVLALGLTGFGLEVVFFLVPLYTAHARRYRDQPRRLWNMVGFLITLFTGGALLLVSNPILHYSGGALVLAAVTWAFLDKRVRR